jgi:hypothetical protein
MYALAVQRNVLDVTAEDPTDALLLLREKVDCERLLGCGWVAQLVRCSGGLAGAGAELLPVVAPEGVRGAKGGCWAGPTAPAAPAAAAPPPLATALTTPGLGCLPAA